MILNTICKELGVVVLLKDTIVEIYEVLSEYCVQLWVFIQTLKTEEIALISIIVSLIIYILSKRAELRFKKYEAKKEKYAIFIEFLADFFVKSKYYKNVNGKRLKEFESKFSEAGANLSVYGSKKLYKEFCFFRQITVDESIRNLKYFDQKLVIYSFAKMLKIMRKEAGLNKDSIGEPTLMLFVINDITKPESLKDYYKCDFKRKMIKFMILGGKIKSNAFFYWLWYSKIKPIISIFVYTVCLIILNMFVKLPGNVWNMIKGNPGNESIS